MFERHKIEKDGNGNSKLAALNKSFGILHGVSSSLNLITFLGTLFHAVFIGSKFPTILVERLN